MKLQTVTTRNRPVWGFLCQTGNDRISIFLPVCRISPDRIRVIKRGNLRLPEFKTPISRISCDLHNTNVDIAFEVNPKIQLSQVRGVDITEDNVQSCLIA